MMVRNLTIANSARAQLEPQYHNPPRITSNVKKSLKLLSLIKEYQATFNRQEKPSTSYRKKKVDKKSVPDDYESYQDPATQVLETKEGLTIITPVLLVDGYNVCGVWPKLKKHFEKGDLVMARELLIDELVSLSEARGIKVVAVFDAKESGLPSHRETKHNVDIIYAADYSADIWIEREVCLLAKDGCPKVRVVTSDSLHREIASASGALVWSCRMLIKEINDVKKELEEIMRSNMPYSWRGKLLEDNLNPQAVSSLRALKQQLKTEQQQQQQQ